MLIKFFGFQLHSVGLQIFSTFAAGLNAIRVEEMVMEDSDTMGYDGGRDDKNDIHSTAVRAGKRTYFFDVKATRNDDYYITITESKRRQGEEASYEKHKIFLYREDFNKFKMGLAEAIDYIVEHKGEVEPREEDDDEQGY